MPFAGIPLTSIWPTKSRSRSSSIRPSVDLSTISDDFGLPTADDPDPFGVLALEKAGLEIREASSKSRPASDAFEYRPSPTSPAFRYSFQSLDGASMRDSKRNSRRSTMSIDHGTQTADLPSPVAITEPPRVHHGHFRRDSELGRDIHDLTETIDEDEEKEEESHFEEPEVLEDAIVSEAEPAVQVISRKAITSPIATHAKLVTIPKRPPPALPMRSPFRPRLNPPTMAADEQDIQENDYQDDCSSTYSSSPTKSAFDLVSQDGYSSNPWSALTSMQDSESVRQKDDGSPRQGSMDFSDKEERERRETFELDRHSLELPKEVGGEICNDSEQDMTKLSQSMDGTTAEGAIQIGVSGTSKDVPSTASISEALQQDENSVLEEVTTSKKPADIRDDASISSFYEDEERQKEERDIDQFHSMPATPVDSSF